MKLFLLKTRYFILHCIGFIISHKAITRKKLVLGSVILGMIAVSSCRVIPPRTCYKPAPPQPPEQTDTETDETTTD